MRHISLDFWNTVGKPNKTYARERSQLLSEVFGVSFEAAKETYSKVKGALDHAAETGGIDYGREYNIKALCTAFGRDADQALLDRIGGGFDALFAAHPPTIDPALILLLNRAHEAGITLSIGSNTNFIEGRVILAHALGRSIPFDFTVFSDEIGYSKPHSIFFAIMAKQAMFHNPRLLDRSEIAHVGDSHPCDCKGAEAAGMKFAYTEHADQTAMVVRGLLEVAA